jgi:hypothetical protein
MSESDSSFYQRRLSSGAYTRLTEKISDFKSRALVFSEYKRDFSQDSNKNFVCKNPSGKSVPFKTWLFGEIAPRDVGTLHQASGNHYLGKRPVCLYPFPFLFSHPHAVSVHIALRSHYGRHSSQRRIYAKKAY